MELLRTAHRVGQIADVLFAKASERKGRLGDVTTRQLLILDAIARKPGASQTELVRDTGMDRSTLADMARRLAKRGLVTRRRSQADARAYVVKLTKDGEMLLSRASGHVALIEKQMLVALPAITKLAEQTRRMERDAAGEVEAA